MASVRSLDNALEVSDAIMAADGLNQPKITGDDGRTHIPNNGRILRNLIHGADTVMSHITHFYALAALDYVDVSDLGAPFGPRYTVSNATVVPAQLGSTYVMRNGASVLANYLESLVMRRKAHTMSAIFAGRHPIQNAIVPGGVSTLPTASDVTKFSSLLNTIRNFINTAYIFDVCTVANAYSGYWILSQPGHLLSYGEYPIQAGTSSEVLLFGRGVVNSHATIAVNTLAFNGAGCPTAFLGNITEHVGYSYYSSPSKLAPSVGKTEPAVAYVGTTRYSWLKAPRFGSSNLVCEVGPMPRLVVSYAAGVNQIVSGTGAGVTALTTGFGETYTLNNLITTALTLVNKTGQVTALVSVLGRHACRALETKFIADAMADTGLTGAAGTGNAWLSELKGTANAGLTNPVYVYAKLPSKPKMGAGWAEAPRGALGHWITIDKKKIASYQCVVPTTWNHSPKDDSAVQGAAEQVLDGLGALGSLATLSTDDIVLTCLRVLHVWDFCIACAVHIVKPDGSTVAKFTMETDGSVKKLPLDAEI